jgi:hypothetical protein
MYTFQMLCIRSCKIIIPQNNKIQKMTYMSSGIYNFLAGFIFAAIISLLIVYFLSPLGLMGLKGFRKALLPSELQATTRSGCSFIIPQEACLYEVWTPSEGGHDTYALLVSIENATLISESVSVVSRSNATVNVLK